MNIKISNVIWGIFLILAGVFFLLLNFGYLVFITPSIWVYLFGGISLLFFIGYFLGGGRQWGLLFPACILGSLALTITLSNLGYSSSFIGSPILAAIGIPFLVAFFLDRRANWWALIPAWVMFILTLITGLADTAPGELIGSIFLFAIGLPFLVVYFTNRTRWWALIPGLILSCLALVPLLASQAKEEFIASFVLAGISIPFLAIYLTKRVHWWALIPFGILVSISISLLFIGSEVFNGKLEGFYASIMLLGFSLTFGVLWYLRSIHFTDWAIYPAIVFAGISLFMAIFSVGLEIIWPLLIISAGIILLYIGMRKNRATELK
jgi:hypothetical protein